VGGVNVRVGGSGTSPVLLALPLKLLLGSNLAIVKPLAVGHLHHAGWPLLMLDAVPVRAGATGMAGEGSGTGGGFVLGMIIPSSLPSEENRESSLLL
jgi:hypothetical protein